MTGGSPVFISCPSCAAKYRWKEELAGKKIKCAKCQAILRMPAESTGDATVIHKPAEEHAAPAVTAPARPAAAAPAKPTPPAPAAAPAPPHPAQEEQHERKPAVDAYDVDDGEETTPPAPTPPKPATAPAVAPKPASPAHPPAAHAPAKPAPAKPAGKPNLDASIGLAGDVALPAAAPAAAGGSKCPSCGNPLGREAVICLNCGYNVKAGSKVQTSVEAGGGEDGGDEPAPKGFKAKLMALTKKKPKKEAVAAEDSSAANGDEKPSLMSKFTSMFKKKK